MGKIARWVSFINSFKFKIYHIRGKDNVIADCLSRLFENTETTEVPQTTSPIPVQDKTTQPPPVLPLFSVPEVFKDISRHQMEDPDLRKIIKSPHKHPNYSVINNTLLYTKPNQTKPRVVVPPKLYDLLFTYYHESPTSAHLGIAKTLARIEHFFWAPNLKSHITDRVRAYVQCQRCKQAPNTKLGKLSSEIVTQPWDKIFIDHIGPLPLSVNRNKYILTVVDAFSKFCLVLPVRNTKAETTAAVLNRHVFSIFGPPKFLVSDNVSNFKSIVIKDLCMGLGIQHLYTSPYYPNPSHAERVNKQIKVAIRIFHSQHQQRWDQELHWFQIAFNSACHESTKTSPARLFLGRNLSHPLELHWNLDQLVNSQNSAQTSQEEWERAVENLKKARQKRQLQYDENRLTNPFQVGDWVMFREHHQSKKADAVNQKLLPVWSKPCVIEAFSSPVTVRLLNPSTGKFIRSAHISQLKRFFQPSFK